MKRLHWACATFGFGAQFGAVPWLESHDLRFFALHAHQLANGCSAALFLLLVTDVFLSPWTRDSWRSHALALCILVLLVPAMLGQRALLYAVAAGTMTSYLLGGSQRRVGGWREQGLLLFAVFGGTLRLASPVLARVSADHTYLPSGPHAVQLAFGLHILMLAWLGAELLACRAQPALRVATAALWGGFFGLCILQPEVPALSPAWGGWREQMGALPGLPSWAVVGLAIGTSVLCTTRRTRKGNTMRALLALAGGAVHPPALTLIALAGAKPEASQREHGRFNGEA